MKRAARQRLHHAGDKFGLLPAFQAERGNGFLHGGLGFYHGSCATWSQLSQRYTREAGNAPIEGKFAKCFICLPQTMHSRGGISAAGSLFVNMNQATRFKAVPRATSGILGSHTETNRLLFAPRKNWSVMISVVPLIPRRMIRWRGQVVFSERRSIFLNAIS